ncbi:hypothetical protein CMUS01_02754 [Colletotrichum musicola]|uniref:Uncharacterized protein n=1 Tax=Colletotrichum musicola TaxID=2175873 RepID=A0A8H6NUD7_9PEZI|nr:hypothetical protein CMUS01_02754 [Colletotrichum musicola]
MPLNLKQEDKLHGVAGIWLIDSLLGRRMQDVKQSIIASSVVEGEEQKRPGPVGAWWAAPKTGKDIVWDSVGSGVPVFIRTSKPGGMSSNVVFAITGPVEKAPPLRGDRASFDVDPHLGTPAETIPLRFLHPPSGYL